MICMTMETEDNIAAIRRLHRRAKVDSIVFLNSDVLYFMSSDGFRSTSGTIICRNGIDPERNRTLSMQIKRLHGYDGASFQLIEESVYLCELIL